MELESEPAKCLQIYNKRTYIFTLQLWRYWAFVSLPVSACMCVCVCMCMHGWPETIKCNFIWIWWHAKPEIFCGYMQFLINLLTEPLGKGLVSYQLHGNLPDTSDFADLASRAAWLSRLFTAGDTSDTRAPSQPNSGIWWFPKETKYASCKSWALDQVTFSFIRWLLDINTEKWFWLKVRFGWRFKAWIFYFRYKCKDYKQENIQDSFQDYKNFIQKAHIGYGDDELSGKWKVPIWNQAFTFFFADYE